MKRIVVFMIIVLLLFVTIVLWEIPWNNNSKYHETYGEAVQKICGDKAVMVVLDYPRNTNKVICDGPYWKQEVLEELDYNFGF